MSVRGSMGMHARTHARTHEARAQTRPTLVVRPFVRSITQIVKIIPFGPVGRGFFIINVRSPKRVAANVAQGLSVVERPGVKHVSVAVHLDGITE